MAIKGAKIGIRGAKLKFGGGKYKSSREGGNKPIRKPKKCGDLFFCFFFGDSKILYFVGAPFEFSGRTPFKLVTPLPVGL